jgi:hypothetical protein
MKRVHGFEALVNARTIAASRVWEGNSAKGDVGARNSKDVFLGLSAIPDSTDCENLYSTIESGELTRDSFGRFCSAHDLPDNLQSEESSARFLEYMRGRCLAWIHMPEDAESILLPLIAKELAKRGQFVIDPEGGVIVE